MALGVSAYSETPFGAEASDVIAYPSGIALTSQIENSTAQANADVNVTGESLTSVVATANGSSVVDVFLTGNQLTFAVGDEESFTDITVEVTSAGNLTVTNITTFEDTLTAFAEAPFASESPSTIAPANVIISANANIIPATNLLTTTIGNEATDADANVSVTGINLTSSAGDVEAFPLTEVPTTGVSLTFAIGNEIARANADVPVTGIVLDSEIGQVDPSPDAMVTGIGMTATVGVGTLVVGTADIDVTGISLTAGIGSLTVTADANIPVTGNTLSTFVGNEDIDADADVAVTGINLNSVAGDVSLTGTGNVSVTGIQLTTAVGDVDHNSTYTVSGVELSTAVGQAEADDASAEVTGVSATLSTGSVNIVAWSEIDPGVNNVWTEVDLAA